jgi:EmrB/QacA subfamily drug resistance transporter
VSAPGALPTGRGPQAAATDADRPARPWLVLAVCCSALFMTGLDTTIVNVGLPDIGRSLHTPVAGLQWTIAAYTVALASMLMFSGATADRIGRRAVFQVGLSLFTLASWLCSLAPNLSWLIAFRLLQGIGGSMLNPAALGIITNIFTAPAARAKAIGVWDATVGLSMALGPVAGGALIGIGGWRSIFWANIPVGLTAIALTALAVPDSRSDRVRRPDPVGQLMVTVMLAALTLAIIQGPSWGWTSTPVLGAFTAAALAARELVRHSRQRDEPLLDVRLFYAVPFSAASLTAVFAIAAQAGFLFLTSLYLQDVRGETALRAGLAILPMPAVMAVCSPACGRILARYGPRIPLLVAGAALTASAVLLTRVTAATGVLPLSAVYGLFGAGVGMVNSPVTNAVMSGVPRSRAGVASGMNSAARQLGASFGVAIAGSVLADSLRPGPAAASMMSAAPVGWMAVTACALAVAVLGTAVAPRTRRPGPRRRRPPAPPEPPFPGTALLPEPDQVWAADGFRLDWQPAHAFPPGWVALGWQNWSYSPDWTWAQAAAHNHSVSRTG